MTPEEYKRKELIQSAILGLVFTFSLFVFMALAFGLGYALWYLMQILGG